MKISYNWLSDFIDLSPASRSPQFVAEALTSLGLEVDDLTPFQLHPVLFDKLVVAEVLEVQKHAQADKLRLAQVRYNTNADPIQVVCGASNLAQGQKVVLALPGTCLHPHGKEPLTIQESTIRGELSFGMLCSESEIGLSTNHDGIMVLPADTSIGQSLSDALGNYQDWIIEVGLTPNRGDAFSHYGVARDLAALWKEEVKFHDVQNLVASNVTAYPTVQIVDTEACQRYACAVLNLDRVGDSPTWLYNRLKAIGLSPINAVVDITNYILHGYGHPLHAFDYSQVEGEQIKVRRAEADETLTTLDKVERKLSEKNLVIANASAPMAIAGVMGGLHSGVQSTTRQILVESAWFRPQDVRLSAKSQGLQSTAAFCYERGADIDFCNKALALAMELLTRHCGATLCSDIVDVWHTSEAKSIAFAPAYISELSGVDIDPQIAEGILTSLGFQVDSAENASWQVTVPSYRTDVTGRNDLVEEVLRVHGLEKVIAPTSLKIPISTTVADPAIVRLRRSMDYLAGQGLSESYFLSYGSLKDMIYAANLEVDARESQSPIKQSVPLLNPMSQDLAYLYDSTFLPGLKAISFNQKRQQDFVGLFSQFSHHYLESSINGSTRVERKTIGAWLAGAEFPSNWVRPAKKNTFFDIKALASASIQKLAPDLHLQEQAFELDYGKGVQYLYQNQADGSTTIAGFALEINSTWLNRWDVAGPVFYAEWYYEELLQQPVHRMIAAMPSKFPKVQRDLSLLVDKNVVFSQVEGAVHACNISYLAGIQAFDFYQGKGVPEDKYSLAIRLSFENKEKTFEDAEVQAIMSKVVLALEQSIGATLRA